MKSDHLTGAHAPIQQAECEKLSAELTKYWLASESRPAEHGPTTPLSALTTGLQLECNVIIVDYPVSSKSITLTICGTARYDFRQVVAFSMMSYLTGDSRPHTSATSEYYR